MTFSGFVFYLHSKEVSIESAFIRSQNTEIYLSTDTALDDSVLGEYDSIAIYPTRKLIPTNTVSPVENDLRVSISKSEVYDQINAYREQKGLSKVTVDSRLERSSLHKAEDMVNNNYFDHKNPWGFINGAGYTFSYAAENLAINYYSSSSLVRGWQNSPSHNQALLDERNQHMGLSYICGVSVAEHQNTCLAVIHFAKEQN